MNRKFEDILNECLDRMLVKGETLEQCLRSYPEHASELKPLLMTALDARRLVDIKPSAEFKAKSRVEFQAALKTATAKKSRFSLFLLPKWTTAVVLVIGLVISGSGTVLAAGNSMPDSPLYSVKILTEEIQMALPASDESKAEKEMEFANERVTEIIYLANKGDTKKIEELTERLDKRLEKVATTLAAKKAAKNAQTAMLAAPGRDATQVPAAVPAPTPPTDSSGGQKFAISSTPPSSERTGGTEVNRDTGAVSTTNVTQNKLKEDVVRNATNQPALLKSMLENVPESSKSALQKAINILNERYEKALEALDD